MTKRYVDITGLKKVALMTSNRYSVYFLENGTGTGMSPLVEQQFASDADHSYVVQDDHH